MSGKWIVFVGLAIVLGLGTVASAATEQDVTLTVTIRSLGISVDPASYAFGMMNTGETKVSATALTITNAGNNTEDVGLKVKTQDDHGEWTVGTPAENVYALSSRLAAAAGTFVAGDALTTAVQWCDGTKFGGGGNDMAAAGTVKQWFQFQSPTSVTGAHAADEHTITVEISCRAAE